MCYQIFDLLLKNNYSRILDPHVQSSIQGWVYRLLQDDSFKDKKVETTSDGIKLSSTQDIHEHNDDILEGKGCVKVTMKTPSTGGQQANPMIDATIVKESKGRGKCKSRNPKVTFAQLLEKY